MKIRFNWARNALSRAFYRLWLLFKNRQEKGNAMASDHVDIELVTKRNIIVIGLVLLWGGLYFSYQYNFQETPRYFTGPLFSIAPTLFLQQFRLTALDFFCSYFYVYGMVVMYLMFWGLAAGSERNMWKFALGFLACWMMQGTLQLAIGAASPVRMPGNGVYFIRLDVFPFSESTMGIKYGAIPSGHLGAPVILFLTGWLRRVRWAEWAALAFFLVFGFVVLYLGEHYLIDIAVSLVLYPVVFYGTWRLATGLDERLERRARGN